MEDLDTDFNGNAQAPMHGIAAELNLIYPANILLDERPAD